MRIAAIDPSTKRIGYAGPDGLVASLTAKAGPHDRARRLSELAGALERHLRLFPPLPELVAIEDYTLEVPGKRALVRLGELGGVLRLRLFELGVDFIEVSPTSLKRHATGRGNATKEQMVDRAHALGAAVTNDDEADAWLLRRMARQAHGLEAMELDHERDAIANAGITW